MIITNCTVCGEEFTKAELLTIDGDQDGLHGQHRDLWVCATGETGKDTDCNCHEDGNQYFAHAECCPACSSAGALLLLSLLFGEGGDEIPPFVNTGSFSVN